MTRWWQLSAQGILASSYYLLKCGIFAQGFMHKRNLHQGRYPIDQLCQLVPELKAFVKTNPKQQQTIDFAQPQAVLLLNQALLAKYYQVKYWLLPQGYLCPPIPGRADYVHHLADLISAEQDEIVKGKQVKVLDIGSGANCIYPIIATRSYGWQFVASDIDPVAVRSAQAIVKTNKNLSAIKPVLQKNKKAIFHGVIRQDDYFDVTMCNPPFYGSAQEAVEQNIQKQQNLNKTKMSPAKIKQQRNFAGQHNELWCPGGELAFVKNMINESVEYQQQVGWFSSLISRREHLPALKKLLKQVSAKKIEVIDMAQGNKISRILAWHF